MPNGLDINLQGLFNENITDISRPYLFRINLPGLVQEGTFGDGYTLTSAWVRTTSLPAYTFPTIDIPLQGLNYKIAGPAEFSGTWTVNLLLDEQHTLRHNIMKWQEKAYNVVSMSHGGPGQYKTNTQYSGDIEGAVNITQVDKSGSPVCTYSFVGLYPSDSGDIELAQEDGDPETMEVTFTYDYFVLASGQESVDIKNGDENDPGFKLPFTIG